jgi:hypothetical protein
MKPTFPLPILPATRRGARTALRAAVVACLCSLSGIAAAAGLSITSPPDGAVVHDNAGTVDVVVGIEDGATLPRGYRVSLLLDGRPAAPEGSGLRFRLTGLDRGVHRLEALIVDDGGRVLTRSAPVEFTVWQASRLNPRGPS